MALEQTLSIIKPDAISKGFAEDICKRLEEGGLKIVSKKSLHLTEEEEDMLDKAWGLESESRLSCQVIVESEELEIELPKYTINMVSEDH